MKRFAVSLFTIVALASMAQSAQAQWVRRYYYRPMFAAPAPVIAPAPVFTPAPVIAPAPVARVYRAPVVMYKPTTVTYTRHRPILGGTVTRTRPAYRRVVF
ncbi:MAG: hypothetical protein R3C10_25200 [Pirellulales bacterium]